MKIAPAAKRGNKRNLLLRSLHCRVVYYGCEPLNGETFLEVELASGDRLTDPRRKWEPDRPIFVAKSVSKSKLSHYLAALATLIVGGRKKKKKKKTEELWRSSLSGQLHSMVAGRSGRPTHSSLIAFSLSSSHEGGDDRQHVILSSRLIIACPHARRSTAS